MADGDKNILITPNIGQTDHPKIEFTGADNNTVSIKVLDDGTLSIEGSSGQLFSVADSLTGTIFSVNDISGIPSIEVFDTGDINLAEYSGIVNVGGQINSTVATGTAPFIVSSSTLVDNLNVESATKLTTARTIDITGDITATAVAFDGSANIAISASVNNDSHTHSDSTIDNLDASAITTGTLTRPTSSSSASCTGNAATVTNGVYTSRTISTTSPLTGGGDLSANRTISIPAATASVDGYMTSTYASKLDGIAASANNYSHPTHPGDDFSVDTGALTGATIVSDIDINVTTDTLGHVTDANGTVSTRTLTLANLGYTGATNANYYTHPTYTAFTESCDTTALTGATVISDLDFNITTDTSGHVTACDITTISTRELTKSDIGLGNVPNLDFSIASNITSGTISSSVLPPLALTDVFVVATEVAQLALTAQEGDVAIRSDISTTYIHNGGTAGTMADWSELSTPLDGVTSVNGYTGPSVTLSQDDVGNGTTYVRTTNDFTDTLLNKLNGIAASANNYSHPTHPGDDFSVDTGALTGATIVSDIDINVTTDTLGHVTDANGTVATRTLTLANLGYTGATNANYYTHPTYTARTESADSGPLTGATVISDLDFNITTDTSGHVTACDITTLATRNLTLADLGYTGATNANYFTYSHPSYDGDDAAIDTGALTGASVISDLDFNVTTDTEGHVTDANATVSTRTLTLADLGYTGTTDANTYVHPTYTARTETGDTGTLTGATVISDLDFNITTDTSGHVTACDITTLATRNLTLADLGYTGATNANYYTHPSYDGDNFSVDTTALTGATVVSDIDINVTTDASGHVTDANGTVATRNLTLADLGYTGDTNAQANVATNISWTAGTTAGPICNSSTGSDSAIPVASATASGVVNTTTQTFAGAKTFSSTIVGSVNGSSASCTGNAATATKLATARSITLSGDVTGTATYDGSATTTITTTVGNDSHTHDTRYYTETELTNHSQSLQMINAEAQKHIITDTSNVNKVELVWNSTESSLDFNFV